MAELRQFNKDGGVNLVWERTQARERALHEASGPVFDGACPLEDVRSFFPLPWLSDGGYLYLIQLVPELSAGRIKAGFAGDVLERLGCYKIPCPTARIAASWPCHADWERRARAWIMATHATLVGGEVFDCADLAATISRGDALFAALPAVTAL